MHPLTTSLILRLSELGCGTAFCSCERVKMFFARQPNELGHGRSAILLYGDRERINWKRPGYKKDKSNKTNQAPRQTKQRGKRKVSRQQGEKRVTTPSNTEHSASVLHRTVGSRKIVFIVILPTLALACKMSNFFSRHCDHSSNGSLSNTSRSFFLQECPYPLEAIAAGRFNCIKKNVFFQNSFGY